MKRVFLGGTCDGSKWREKLIKLLDIDYLNPVPVHMQEQLRQRESCDFCLYVITPEMSGNYSIAEAVDDSNKRPDKTIFCHLESEDGVEFFTDMQIDSLNEVGYLIQRNGGMFLSSLDDVAGYLNKQVF